MRGKRQWDQRVTVPYLAYEQENGYPLPPYLQELVPVDHVAGWSMRW